MELSRIARSVLQSQTIAIDAKAKALKAAGVDVIGFGAGEPDFDTPDNIREAGIRAIKEGKTKYTPASGLPELKKAIVDKFRKENGIEYDTADIVVSNGAKHSLFNAFFAVCNPGDEVIIPAPYWVSYPEIAKICGAKPVYIETDEKDGFTFDIGSLEAKITRNTKVILLNTPSNPTGAVYSSELLEKIAGTAIEKDLVIISDEIYEQLIYDGAVQRSIAAICPEVKDRTIIINGVSKTYAMTGWRIGYSASDKTIAKIMANVQSHSTSNPCTISQYAAIEALAGPQDTVAEMKAHFESRRDYMYETVNRIDKLSCMKPTGAFYIMVNISKTKGLSYKGRTVIDSSDKFAEVLLDEHKVAVVPGSGFGTDDHVRLSYATSMDNIRRGLERMGDFTEKLG